MTWDWNNGHEMNSRRAPNLYLAENPGYGCVRLRNAIVSLLRTAVRAPIWVLQIVSGAKSFADNPILGSRRLNQLGLHAARMRAAHAMADWRRRRLGKRVAQAHRAQFAANGFVVIEDYLPREDFADLRDGILGTQAPAREMLQGDTITRRIAIDSAYLDRMPALRSLIGGRTWRALLRYVASSDSEPLYYVQTILTHRAETVADPQTALHADTFHPTMKAWYFLEDVAEDEGPFCYVPGSHRLTPARLAWERARSIAAPEGVDRLSARGSMRIDVSELDALGLPQPKLFGVKANTLVVADTSGFHARGPSHRPTRRVEIWAYGRRNPFYPWIGLDPLSLPGIRERRISWIWSARDRFPKLFGPPWHNVGKKAPLSD
jgi:hypothetical protein